MTTVREASCQCGELRLRAQGEPVRVSVCHCLDCQRRSGSVFAFQARFAAERVEIKGQPREWTRGGDEGSGAVFSFCPHCGSSVYYRSLEDPDVIAVAVGAFAPWVSGAALLRLRSSQACLGDDRGRYRAL